MTTKHDSPWAVYPEDTTHIGLCVESWISIANIVVQRSVCTIIGLLLIILRNVLKKFDWHL